jgi:hypothetical protein
MILVDNESRTMTYQETLFFVAQCLTISLEEKNRSLIEQKLQKGNVDWDKVVQLSTNHYVLPAMYCNLKRVDFLKYLPEELVSYMSYITQLNRTRNLQIIRQAKAINQLLRAHHMSPIFLKGTGNLLEGLYGNLSERMVGDIDIFVSNKEYQMAVDVLINDNYEILKKEKNIFPFRHYPRMIKKNQIAAIEIHNELIIEKYASTFNYDTIQKETQKINNISVLSFEHQLVLSIAAHQINDHGYHYKHIALRNAYDVFLLSKKVEANSAISKFKNLKHPLDCFLASCYLSFGKVDSLVYKSTKKTHKYLTNFNNLLLDTEKSKVRRKRIDRQLFFKNKFNNLNRLFFDKKYRHWKLNKEFNSLIGNN